MLLFYIAVQHNASTCFIKFFPVFVVYLVLLGNWGCVHYLRFCRHIVGICAFLSTFYTYRIGLGVLCGSYTTDFCASRLSKIVKN